MVKLNNAWILWLKQAGLCVLISEPHPNAAPGICSDFSFKCRNQECVNKVNAECDRVSDCSDNSDEAHCGKEWCSNFLFYFPKQLKVYLISAVIQIDSRRAACWARCWKEPQAFTALFISFSFESSSCHPWNFLFVSPFKPQGVIVSFSFIYCDHPMCQRTLLELKEQ